MIIPTWPAPSNVKAYTYTKLDDPKQSAIAIRLLHQIHGNIVITLPEEMYIEQADGAYTHQKNIACSVKTADCLAVFLCNKQGTEVAALHAGWRGLASGVIAAGIEKFKTPADDLLAWLSPAICAKHYEIDTLVYDTFIEQQSSFSICFEQNRPGHWHFDLWAMARLQLEQLGVTAIFGGNHCTFEEEQTLYSFRREPKNPGRLVHSIWISGA